MPETPPAVGAAAPLTYGRQRFRRSAVRRWVMRIGVGLSVPLVLILSVATPLVWQWSGDARAVAAVRALGGSVTTQQVGPAWVQQWMPSRLEFLLTRAKDISLRNVKPNDADIASFSRLTNAHDLDLYTTNISDASLQMIRNLRSVEALHLGGTRFTDDAVGLVKDMPNLTYLGFHGANITDAALKHIGELPKLESLVLSETQVTDAGLIYLQRC